MRNTKIALAVLALVASTAAMAEGVTISGNFDYAVQANNTPTGTVLNGGAASTSSAGAMRGKSSNLSPNWLIISANEDLGNGMKANATLQNAINLSAGGWNTLGAKVSLSGDFGSVTLGDWLDPLFLAAAGHSASTDGGSNIGGILNPLFSTATGATGAWSRNLFIYDTPSVGGINGSYAHSFGNVAGSSAASSYDSFRVGYSAGPVSATAAYKTINDTTAATSSRSNKIVLLGAGYDFGVAKINYLRMTTDNTLTARTEDKTTTDGANVSVPVDNWNFGLSYYKTKVDNNTDKGTTTVLSAQYNLSKRTMLFANHQAINNTTTGIYDLNAGGSAADTFTSIVGSARATTVGVRHSF
jgi:hypothetical protein